MNYPSFDMLNYCIIKKFKTSLKMEKKLLAAQDFISFE